MFQRLRDRLAAWRTKAETLAPDEVVVDEGGRRISPAKLDELLSDLEIVLLEADVAVPVAEAIEKQFKDDLAGKRLSRDIEVVEAVELALKAAVKKVLSLPSVDLVAFARSHEKPVILMFVGVNGTGKTTAIAKLTYLFQKEGLTTVLAAGDTFRAGAIEQLEQHADRLGTKLIKHQAGSDPAAVAFDAVEHAKARRRDIVLIDTAGRMQTNANLMDQMKKIKRVAKPHLIIYVGDALAGNDAVEQARQFHDAVGISAVILTKIDADAKGGAALSIAQTIGRPIAYLSTGQEYEAFTRFDPDWMVERLFAE